MIVQSAIMDVFHLSRWWRWESAVYGSQCPIRAQVRLAVAALPLGDPPLVRLAWRRVARSLTSLGSVANPRPSAGVRA